MKGFEAYKIYVALNLHYSKGNYDAFKYNFKVNLSPDSYNKKHDKFFFERIGSKYKTQNSVVKYFAANILKEVSWVGNMKEENFLEFEKRLQALSYNFKKDVEVLYLECPDFNKLCRSSGIIDLLNEDRVSIESLGILDYLVNFLERLRNTVDDPFDFYIELADKIIAHRKLMQYIGVLNIDKKKYKEMILKYYEPGKKR